MSELSELDSRILAFEENAPISLGAKEESIRSEFGLSPTRYYQRLNMLIDTPAASAAHPLLVSRLRKRRDERAKARQNAKIYNRVQQ